MPALSDSPCVQLPGILFAVNVFLYDNHIETYYQSRGFEPLSLVVYHDLFSQASNMFLYGRTARTRTGNWRIKSPL